MNAFVKKRNALVEILILMIILQAALFIMESILKNVFGTTIFAKKMITMSCMLVLFVILLFTAHIRNISLPLLPKKFSKAYVIFTIIALILIFSTPSIYTIGFTELMTVIYGSIVTPIYEEYLFRGLIWDKLENSFDNEKTVLIINALLFSIWHIGYVIPAMMSGNWFAVISKMAVGLIYGLILGFVKVKTRNCYSTILLHGVLNVFAI